jgi:hypothetical protein
MTRVFGGLDSVVGLRRCDRALGGGCALGEDFGLDSPTGVTVAVDSGIVLGCEAAAGVSATAVWGVATRLAEAAIGVPPLTPPPPSETTRVDKMGVLPPAVCLDPSCNGIISFREPLSSTI